MAVFKGRRGKEIAGRRLACFAAAFFAVMFCLCYNLRNTDRGILWSIAALSAVFIFMSLTGYAKRGAAIVIAAGISAILLFYISVYPDYVWAEKTAG